MSLESWNPRKPKALAQSTDVISSVALSDYAVHRTVKSNLAKFSRQCGVSYSIGKEISTHVSKHSASNETKIKDLAEVLGGKNTRMLICATGGYSASSLVREKEEELYDLFNDNPVLWTGYSDAGVISMFLLSQLNLVSASSPNAWGLYSDWNDLSRKQLENFAFGRSTSLYLDHSWEVHREGEAEGVVIVANTGTLCNALGTFYDPLLKLAENGIPIILVGETFSTTLDEVAAELDQIFSQRIPVPISAFVLGGRYPDIFPGPYKEFHRTNSLTDVISRGLPPEIPWGVLKCFGHPEFGYGKRYKKKSEANLFMETIPFGVRGKITLGKECNLVYECPVELP